jgi:hypothetical protein
MEGNTGEAEWRVVGCGAGIFARTKKKVEGDGAHVGDGLTVRKVGVKEGLM